MGQDRVGGGMAARQAVHGTLVWPAFDTTVTGWAMDKPVERIRVVGTSPETDEAGVKFVLGQYGEVLDAKTGYISSKKLPGCSNGIWTVRLILERCKTLPPFLIMKEEGEIWQLTTGEMSVCWKCGLKGHIGDKCLQDVSALASGLTGPAVIQQPSWAHVVRGVQVAPHHPLPPAQPLLPSVGVLSRPISVGALVLAKTALVRYLPLVEKQVNEIIGKVFSGKEVVSGEVDGYHAAGGQANSRAEVGGNEIPGNNMIEIDVSEADVGKKSNCGISGVQKAVYKEVTDEVYQPGQFDDLVDHVDTSEKFGDTIDNLSMEVQQDLDNYSAESELVGGNMIRSESGLPFTSSDSSLVTQKRQRKKAKFSHPSDSQNSDENVEIFENKVMDCDNDDYARDTNDFEYLGQATSNELSFDSQGTSKAAISPNFQLKVIVPLASESLSDSSEKDLSFGSPVHPPLPTPEKPTSKQEETD